MVACNFRRMRTQHVRIFTDTLASLRDAEVSSPYLAGPTTDRPAMTRNVVAAIACKRCAGNHSFSHICGKKRNRPALSIPLTERSTRVRRHASMPAEQLASMMNGRVGSRAGGELMDVSTTSEVHSVGTDTFVGAQAAVSIDEMDLARGTMHADGEPNIPNAPNGSYCTTKNHVDVQPRQTAALDVHAINRPGDGDAESAAHGGARDGDARAWHRERERCPQWIADRRHTGGDARRTGELDSVSTKPAKPCNAFLCVSSRIVCRAPTHSLPPLPISMSLVLLRLRAAPT